MTPEPAAQPEPFQGATPEELAWLAALAAQNGYLAPVPIGGGRYACIAPFAFTHAIITGAIGDSWGYADRWCFASMGKALVGLAEWAGRSWEGEPLGWHRHPDSGRRRPDGDPAQEYINP